MLKKKVKRYKRNYTFSEMDYFMPLFLCLQTETIVSLNNFCFSFINWKLKIEKMFI